MKQTDLITTQKYERDFLYDLSNALSECDLSKLDLKTLPGAHPAHSVLFDNYELNIVRTPVFVHKNKFAQLMGIGDWKFQEGIYERYEIFILENAQNLRASDIIRYSGKLPANIHNIILQRGTMATDRGYFPPSKHAIYDDEDELYYKQNSHLFAPVKNIYNTLNVQAAQRQSQVKDFLLSDIKSAKDLQIARMRMLGAVRQN